MEVSHVIWIFLNSFGNSQLVKNRMFFKGKELIVWSYNDYLGLTSDEKVIEVEVEAVKKYGISYPTGSRVLAGNTEFHEKLEYELSLLTGKSCMILNLGYVGIVSIIQSVVDRHDIIIYDQEVHACLLDGITLHKGDRYSFKHNDKEHFENQLKKSIKLRKKNSEIIVIVDGVYSMRGDTSILREIADLKKIYDFTLLVDDSHGFLVFNGIGTPSLLNVMDSVDIYISTFGKALGTLGGFVSADKEFINFFKYNLRSQIYARSLSVVNILSVLYKLDLLKNDNTRRDTLWKNTNLLQNGLKDIGLNIKETSSPITPIYIEGVINAKKMVNYLREVKNIFCSGVVYPIVPKDTILLRLIVTALHTNEDIEMTLKAFSEL